WAGTANLSSECWRSSMNASHSLAVIFKWACDSAIGLPLYFCGPPPAQQTISVTRYLNPGGGTRWCASFTRGLAFSLGSFITRSMKSSTTVAMLYTPPSLSYKDGFSAESMLNLLVGEQSTRKAELRGGTEPS